MTERVLITGARAPAALDLARSFKAAGFEVHMADSKPSRMAGFSRAVTTVHHYPSPRLNFARFTEALSELHERLAPRIMVPTCEEVFYAATLAPKAPVFAPPLAVLRRLHSKHAFANDAASLGLATPPTTLITSDDDLQRVAGEADELVLKPEFSRFGSSTLVSPSREALLAIRPSALAPWVAQRRVRGVEVSFYAVSVGSMLTAFAAYRSAWKFDGGAGYAFETLDPALHDRLLAIASELAARLIPDGQFACDVIVDEQDTPWLLECNPRATSGVHLFDRSAALAHALLGKNTAPLLCSSAALKHVGPALWAYGLPDALQHGRLPEWRARRRQSADVISAQHDRAPIAGALIDTLDMSASALWRGKSLTEIATIDIEWNGEPL